LKALKVVWDPTKHIYRLWDGTEPALYEDFPLAVLEDLLWVIKQYSPSFRCVRPGGYQYWLRAPPAQTEPAPGSQPNEGAPGGVQPPVRSGDRRYPDPSRQGPSVIVPDASSRVGVQLCSISGQLALDPNDHTNGYIHYKGKIAFKALADLQGTNIRLSAQYFCTCVSCPTLSSHALGLRPEGAFHKNQVRNYFVDCPFWQKSPPPGATGRADIEYFTATSRKAGVFRKAVCTVSFGFTK
jgi:hypothetical protein